MFYAVPDIENHVIMQVQACAMMYYNLLEVIFFIVSALLSQATSVKSLKT